MRRSSLAYIAVLLVLSGCADKSNRSEIPTAPTNPVNPPTPLSVEPTRSEIPEGTSKLFRVRGGNPNTEPGFGLRVWGRVAGTTVSPARLGDAFTPLAGRIEKFEDQHRFVSSSTLTQTLRQNGWDFDHIEIEIRSIGVAPVYMRICFNGYICHAPER